MIKYVALILAVVAAVSAQLLYGGLTGPELTGPSFHGPFAHSYDTGIRRYGSTAGFAYAAAPAYVADHGYGHFY